MTKMLEPPVDTMLADVRNDLHEAAIRLKRIRRRRRLALMALALVTVFVASTAAATDGFHFLFSRDDSGAIVPIDNCAPEGDNVLVCVSDIGTSFLVKDSSGAWTPPRNCVNVTPTERECTTPYRLRVDLQDPLHPKVTPLSR
jgi:hypothetical protein